MKNDFAFSLFDLDWDVFSVHVEGACNRVPAIEMTGVKSTVCGPGEWSYNFHQVNVGFLHEKWCKTKLF